MDCRQDVHDAYNERLQAEMDTMVWSHPTIRHSFFQNDSGKIHILSPWRLVDYWTWTREPDLDEFVLADIGESTAMAAQEAPRDPLRAPLGSSAARSGGRQLRHDGPRSWHLQRNPFDHQRDNMLYFNDRNKTVETEQISIVLEGVMRFRIDGVMHHVYELPPAVNAAVTSRLKILGRFLLIGAHTGGGSGSNCRDGQEGSAQAESVSRSSPPRSPSRRSRSAAERRRCCGSSPHAG